LKKEEPSNDKLKEEGNGKTQLLGKGEESK